MLISGNSPVLTTAEASIKIDIKIYSGIAFSVCKSGDQVILN